MLDHSCQTQRHPHAERGVDLYETPSVAVEALLRVERLPLRIWEPACGKSCNIVNVLRAQGHDVYASDLMDYGTDPTAHYGRDFLHEHQAPEGYECIVTNPPFQWAEPFVAHALELCPLVVMLLRTAFLESERRTGILEGRGLARVHVFRKRLPMMHRAGWQGRKANSGISFSWFVWHRKYRGAPSVHRISWERAEPVIRIGKHGGKRIKGRKQSANGTLKRGSNSRAYIIARLRRDGRADLAAQVEMRMLSARAAALAAGVRKQ
jgi:hypothetical protein